MPGDWMSVSTTPTRSPRARRQHRDVRGRVRLAGPAAEGVERRRRGSSRGAQRVGLALQVAEVVGLGDLGDLACRPSPRRSRSAARWTCGAARCSRAATSRAIRWKTRARLPSASSRRRPRPGRRRRTCRPRRPPAASTTWPTCSRYSRSRSAQALAREAGVDARAQQRRAERLGQVVVGAELDAAHDAVGLVEAEIMITGRWRRSGSARMRSSTS